MSLCLLLMISSLLVLTLTVEMKLLVSEFGLLGLRLRRMKWQLLKWRRLFRALTYRKLLGSRVSVAMRPRVRGLLGVTILKQQL